MRCHTTNGRWDIVVELGVESLEAFDQALQRIQLTKGISNSETSLLLSTYKICPRRKIGSHQMQQQFELRASHTLRALSFSRRSEDTLRDQTFHTTKHKL